MDTNPDRAIDPIGILKLNAPMNLRKPNVSYHTLSLALVGNLAVANSR